MADYGNAGVQSRAKPQGRANVLQLKLIGQSHSTGLTANLLRLFEPRAPLEYKPPVEKRKLPAYSGIAQFVAQFTEPGDPEFATPVAKGETRAEKKARIRQLKLEQGATKVAEELQNYDPQSDPNATGDPYKTLFVARLSYETSEHRLKREFEAYGPIKRVQLVTDKETKKPRGYAFVEYVHTRDMKNAYKQADGRKLDNKRVLVDVERGRTVPNWRPRRLGGGLGSSRIGGEGADHKRAAREQQLAWRPRSEEPRRDDRHADRDREKSHERVQGRDRDGRTRERLYDRTRDRESREERHNHRDRDRTWDKDQERDRERDHGRDRHDRYKHRDHGREREHGRSHDRRRDRGKDRENGDPRHERNMADYGLDYGYNQYEQHKGHGTYDYGRDEHGHETERSKGHKHEYYRVDSYSKMAANYQAQPNNTEPEAPEEGDYQFHQADN